MDLPPCANCDVRRWSLIETHTYGPWDRRARIFRCDGCGAEGRYFDGGIDPEVASGAMVPRRTDP